MGMLQFGGPVYEQRNPDDMPSPYASDEEWQAYRAKQKLAREFTGTNQSGITPQQIEANAVDPVKAALARLMASPNAATIGEFSNDPTYSAKTIQNSGGDVSTSKETPAPTQEETILAMAFPEVFRKQPPTGEVNTKGGADRVNARTAEHGTRAITGPDGKITLTNINADGSVNKGTGSPNSIGGDGRGVRVAPDIPSNLSSSVQLLRNATSLAEAQGIMLNINETLAQQSSKLNEDAIKFGVNRVGLPALQAELQQALAADRNDPKWYPGIGDSSITKALRTQIAQAEGVAENVAKNFLSSNTQAAALRAMEGNAKLIFDQISRQAQFDREQAQRKEDRTYQVGLTAQAKEEYNARQKQERIDMEIGPLSNKQLTRMAVIDGGLKDASGNIDPNKAQASAFSLKKRNPQELQQVLDLPDEELPGVALAGNEYAMTVVIANELKNNPGASEKMVREKLALVRQRALDPSFQTAADAFKLEGLTGEDAKRAKVSLNQQKNDRLLNKQDKNLAKQHAMENFNIALRMEQATASRTAIEEASTIIDPNGPLGPAMKEAQKITGRRNLGDVWTAYKSLNTSENALKLAQQFNDIVWQSIGNAPDSIFGKPSQVKVNTYLLESQRNVMRELLKLGQEFAHYPMEPYRDKFNAFFNPNRNGQ